MKKEVIEKSYQLAKEQYAVLGIDTEKVLTDLDNICISLHCWQTDDVGGFEKAGSVLGGGGIQATGNFPGKAKTIEQMRSDLDKVMSLLPGKQRLSLHAIYGEFGGILVVWILTAHVSHIHLQTTVSLSPARTRKSENSGWNIQKDAGLSVRKWANN
jgi:L-rhamnose isomerase